MNIFPGTDTLQAGEFKEVYAKNTEGAYRR
jgi:hypothetical protein